MKSLSKRSVLNLNFPPTHIYDLINQAKFVYNFPASSNFSGPYVIQWTGAANGTVNFNWSTNITIDVGASTPISNVTSSTFKATTANPRVVFSFAGGEPLKTRGDLRFPSGSTNRSLRRLSDEDDFLSGNYFRRTYLQILADLNPSCIRTLDWFGGNDTHFMRWEDRSLPTDVNWQGTNVNGAEANPSGNEPLYGTTSGTNIYTLAAIGSTPASEFHGHVAQCTIGSGIVRGGNNPITNVTRANPGVATYTGTDNSQNGDKVIFRVGGGMVELDYRICTVANVDTGAKTFELSGLDTSGFAAWSGSDNGITSPRRVMQYVSLKVGTWGAYPVIFSDAITPAANYSSAYVATSDIKAFYFDKTMVAAKDEVTGASIQGAWIFNGLGSLNYHRVGVPPGVIIKFITELNAVAVARGKGPIDLWINIPQRGMLSMDPDYSDASNVAIKFVDMFLNGGDGVSAAPSNIKLFIELSNETWNGAAGFTAFSYFSRRGQLRWGGGTNTALNPFHGLRHAVMVSDIRASFPNDLGRIVFNMCGQDVVGVASGNLVRMDGDSTLSADALYQSLGGGAIGTHKQFWDMFCAAPYIAMKSSFASGTLPGLVTQWVSGDAAQKDAAIVSCLDAFINDVTNQDSIVRSKTRLDSYNSAMQSRDRVYGDYEGGNQFLIRTTVDDTYNFLWTCRSDQRWADAFRDFLDYHLAPSNVAMPAEYVMLQSASIDHTWDHISYGNADTYANGVEGAALDLAWDEITDYNNPDEGSTHVGGASYLTPEELAAIRRYWEELEDGRELSRKKRNELEDRLTRTIEAAYDKALGIEPQAAKAIAAVVPKAALLPSPEIGQSRKTASPSIDWSRLSKDLDAVDRVLRVIGTQIDHLDDNAKLSAAQRVKLDRLRRDEENIQLLMLAL